MAVNFLVGFVHSVKLLMGLFQAFELVGGVDEDAISLVRVHMDVDICGRDGLHGVGGTVIEQVGNRHGEVFLTDVEVRQSREHHSVVILLLTEFILQAHNLETLTTNLAPVDGALTHHIIDLFV